MNDLDPDLQRILNINAKVYNTKSRRQGKVIFVDEEIVHVDYGNKAKSDIQDYDIDDFKQMLISDEVVANSRLTMDGKENFKIKPRVKSAQPVNITQDVKVESEPGLIYTKDIHPPKPFIPAVEISSELKEPCITSRQPAQIGYINFTDGQYSDNPRKGFTKVEFRKVIEQVTLELTSEQIDQLKEMGLMK